MKLLEGSRYWCAGLEHGHATDAPLVGVIKSYGVSGLLVCASCHAEWLRQREPYAVRGYLEDQPYTPVTRY